MTIEQLRDAATAVVKLLDEYSGDHIGKREMLLDPILYAYLNGRFAKMSRQHPVKMSGWKHAKRIDFRQGGHNPVVIEFAVRPRTGGRSNLSAGQNQSELHKLTRIQQSAARLRVLLLVDLASDVIDRDDLIASYADVGGGPGAFVHYSVRVLYIHRSTSYSFIWRP